MPNFILVAQNTQDVDYVKQACALAMSIHATTPDSNISILTDDTIPQRYKELFDNVIKIPWGDLANKYDWKIHNRWKTYFISPYEDAIVLDTDMLVLEDITSWYNFLQSYDMYITSTIFDYRGNKIKDTFYRKNFNRYNLPNTYMGLHYFKKSEFALEFYTWLDKITNNWKEFYKLSGSNPIQNFASMDLTAAMAIDILEIRYMIILETPKFELVYKVYFDKDTGNILSISNVEQDIETNFIIAIQDALPYLDGTKNVTRHKVVYDIRTSSYIIVDKYKKLEIDVNDNVYKIEQQAKHYNLVLHKRIIQTSSMSTLQQR